MKKVIRDSVHGDIVLDQKQTAIIEHPSFQRLKRISQNGFLYLVYPGMKHSRFEHSLGAFHLASRWVKELCETKTIESALLRKNNNSFPFGTITDGTTVFLDKTFSLFSDLNGIWGDIVKVAALVHDVGHGPLSHTLEKCELLSLKNIDDWAITLEIKTFLSSKEKIEHEDFTLLYLNRILIEKKSSFELDGTNLDKFILRVAALLHKDFKEFYLKKYQEDTDHIFLFSNLISSLFDVDRMDYLRRDSQKAGVEYGFVDFNRIIKTIVPVLYQSQGGKLGSGFITNARNIHVLDHFLVSLFEMYTILYLHPKNISSDHEFIQIISLLKDCNKIEAIDIKSHSQLDEWSFLENIDQLTNGFLKRFLDRQTPKAEIFQVFTRQNFSLDNNLKYISQKSKRPFFKGNEKVFLMEPDFPKQTTKITSWEHISLVAKNLNSESYSPQVWWKNNSFMDELDKLKSKISENTETQGATKAKS